MSGDNLCYLELVEHYEDCFEQHGATPKGVDWPNSQDLIKRFDVMLAGMQSLLAANVTIKLLDVGCGYGALLDYIKTKDWSDQIQYHGVDLSPKMIAYAKQVYPEHHFEVRDILLNPFEADSFDYAIFNGVFTEKRQLSQSQMENFLAEMLSKAYQCCQFGFAFNVMNHHVDWYRDELFYLPFDQAATLIKAHCSRHYRFNADYGLYEYTTYVYRQDATYDRN